uniref:leucine-rich repeat domain-containing protein n=1 Tax=Eubacterium cellulosolvens TaxID=29322 RepID=UPI0009DE7544|nr:leucine-rich repeat domain-containing protein [[Eubacterium] cellulosolvens]
MRKQKILAIVAACVLATSCPYTVIAGEIEKQEVTTEVYAAPGDVILSGDASATAEDHVTWEVVQNADGEFKLIISGKGNMKKEYQEDEIPYGVGELPYRIKEQLNALAASDYEMQIFHEGVDAHISEVEVREGVTSICSFAHSEIEKVSLPSGITEIGENTFEYCDKLSEINIPDTVTSIGENAFFRCFKLSEINIPDTVTSIGGYAFGDCPLKTIKLPPYLEYLGDYAFRDTELTSVTLPPVKNLGDSIFEGCDYLKKAVIEEGNTRISARMFWSWQAVWELYPRSVLEEVVLPKSLETIEENAFYGCIKLKKINIPENVTTIEDNAFSGCSGLKEIHIPESVREIRAGAWNRCSNLKTVYLPHSLEKFYAYTEPSGVEWVEYGGHGCSYYTGYQDPVFAAYHTPLTDIYYNGTKAEWKMVKKYFPQITFSKYNEGTKHEYTAARITGWEETNKDSFTDEGITIHYLESEKPSTKPTATPIPEENKAVAMQRLYHPITQEHFYTKSEHEKNVLVSRGWKYEGIGWCAPEDSDTPVYRLYNPVLRDHHYTTDKHEKDVLSTKYGWKYEGIGWYSDDNKTVPIYRRYCPLLKSGSHHYTPALNEAQHLVKVGWKDEGIAWYGLDPDKK